MAAPSASDPLAFISYFEGGVIPWLYIDSRWQITTGIGFLVPDVESLKHFQWLPSLPSAIGDYKALLDMRPSAELMAKLDQPRAASSFRNLTHARLRAETVAPEFAVRLQLFESALRSNGWKLEQHPQEVRTVLLDLAYNLGVRGLNRFVKLKAALLARDYATAAAECLRKDVQLERNEACARTLLAQASIT